MVCDSVDRVVLERDRIAKPLDLADADEELDVRRHPAARQGGARVWRCSVVDPDDARRAARAPRRRAAAARHVGDARLLQATRRDRGAVPRRLAVHRRPGLHRSTASWCCAGASRTSSSSAAATCSPRTSSAPCGALDGVRAGNVIAFGVEGYKGKESVVVVAEVRTDDPAARSARRSTIARSRCAGCRRAT